MSGFNVDAEIKTFSTVFYSENAGGRPLLSTSSIAGMLFGAVHCLAWNFSFPSHVERVMWRAASLGVVGSCAVIFCSALFFKFIRLNDSLLVPGGLASFVYPVARITLLVLAVTSLRSLPSSAFDAIDWVELVPHI